MSRGRRSGGKRAAEKRKQVVVIYGEDQNDTKSLKELFLALCPEFTGEIRTPRQPQIHMKSIPIDQLPGKAEKIRRQIAAETADTEDVVCVYVHEDADACEPVHREVAARLSEGFSRAGLRVHIVAPAWEIEAWWFQWPEQVKRVRPSWRKPDQYVRQSTGAIVDAKREFKRCVAPAQVRAGFLGYRESDSIAIARQVRLDGVARAPQASSESYEHFVESVDSCCPSAAGR